MSSNENDAFDNLFNEFAGQGAQEQEQESEAPAEENPVNAESETDEDAPEDTLAPEDETAEEEQEAPEDEEESEEPAPKPKGKKSAEERIREVVSKQRQAERERDAERAEKEDLRRRIEQLEAVKEAPKPEAPTPAGNEFGLTEPTPDDVDASGESKYPLGSFDPNFMRDLNRYDRAVERAYENKIAKEQAALNKQQAEEQRLFDEWNGKLTEAEKTSPDIRAKAEKLVNTFTDAEPQHMQTLAQTIMQLDNGPSVLEYLADNLDEADSLVKMPTTKALLQLGRLDGLFVPEEAEETAAPVKATKAPPPPAKLARGSGAQKGGPNTLYDKMLRDFR